MGPTFDKARLCCGALALLLLAGCSGPRSAIEVSVNEYPGDVLLGAKEKNTAQPVNVEEIPSAVNLEPVGFPSFIQPPPPVPEEEFDTTATTRRPPPPPPPCPVANALASPKIAASANVTGPPVASSYVYRNQGVFEVRDAAGSRSGNYPTEVTRKIEPSAVAPDKTFTFTVSESLAESGSRAPVTETTTTFFVDPAAGGGIYIQSIESKYADGGSDFFAPQDRKSLPILPLPATANLLFSGNGVSPLTGTSLRYDAVVQADPKGPAPNSGKVLVDACGTPLDAWQVKVTNGKIQAPNKQLEFTATYAIGTQYGGIVVRDALAISCDDEVSVFCDNNRAVKTSNIATISREPRTR